MQAYSGRRYDSAGNDLNHQGRSLEKINQYKLNEKYKQQNIKQQAGFDAELLEEANRNHDAILKGDPSQRRTTDGIGRTNDTQYDLVTVDENGNVSDPSQMKFSGVNQKGQYTVIEKLAKDRSWDRYDAPVDVPKDQYPKAKAYADQQAQQHAENAKHLREAGKYDKAAKEEQLSQQYKKAGERIRASSVTEKEAIQARINPKAVAAKHIISDAHQAGMNAAKSSALVGGSIALVQNICAVGNGDITVEEAAQNVATTTVKAGVSAYAVAGIGSTVKAFMHNSKNEIIRKAGTTSFPAMAATSVVEISSVVKEYISGNINETEALTRLGKSGTGMVTSAWGAMVGTAVAGPIGSMIGSMVGYMISSSIYDTCLNIMRERDLVREEYERTHALCMEAIEAMRQQRREFEAKVQAMLDNRQKCMDTAIPAIMNSIDSDDTENFTRSIRSLAEAFNQQLQFKSFDEFDAFMSNTQDAFVF